MSRKKRASTNEVRISIRRRMGFVILASVLVVGLAVAIGLPGSGQPGATWIGPTTAFAGEPTSLSALPEDGALLAATTEGLFATRDDGRTWSALEPGDGSIQDVVARPDRSEVAYVAGPDLGVVKTTDGGATWTPSTNGLPSDEVQALAMHTDNYNILYASIGQQIFESRDGAASWWEPVDGPPDAPKALDHSTLAGSMNTGWLYSATDTGPYLSMD